MKCKTNVALSVLVPALLALALLMAACGGGAMTLAKPTVAGTIAFTKRAGEGGDIYVVNPDGTGLRPLAETVEWEEDPSWSPDGSRIVYTAYVPGNIYVEFAAVWAMNADGSARAQLSKGYGWSPAWSPDGKQVAYVRLLYTPKVHTPVAISEPCQADVLIMSADGSGTRTLTCTDSLPVAPSWGPNGDIFFLRHGDLCSIHPDGTGEVQLTKDWNMGEYALSPDGQTLAYRDLVNNAIVARSLHGGGAPVTLLGQATRFIKHDPLAALAWTPDGGAVAVASGSFDGFSGSPLYIVNADGSGLSQVPGIDAAWDPTWLPQ